MSQVMSIRAGRTNVGDVAYENYIGQIDPADIAAIIWYGVGGDDTTGDGSFANPYLTFARAILDVSATKIYVLETSLNGKYELTNKIYWDPTRPDDTGSGLTPALAKKTYGAAKTAAIGAGYTIIEAIGTFTMTDLLDFNVQGQIGFTLTYNRTPDYLPAVPVQSAGNAFRDLAKNPTTETLVAVGINGASALVYRSTDGGATWSAISTPWTAPNQGNPHGITYGNGKFVIVGTGGGGATNNIMYSVDDGLTWIAIAQNVNIYDIKWTGTNFVYCGIKTGGGGANARIGTSPDAITWTARTSSIAGGTAQLIKLETDGNGLVVITGYDGANSRLESSPDHGVTWTDRTGLLPVTGRVTKIAYGGGLWLLRLDAGATRFYTSTSPTTLWTAGPAGLQEMEVGFPQGASINYSEFLGGFVYVSTISGPTLYLVTKSSTTVIVNLTGNTFYGAIAYSYKGASYCAAMSGPATGIIERVLLHKVNVLANVTNAKMDASQVAAIVPLKQLSNFTAIRTTGIASEIHSGAEANRTWIESLNGLSIKAWSGKFSLSESVSKSSTDALTIEAAAYVLNDINIDKSIISGNYVLKNMSGTNLERCRDTIITGNFTASAVTSMESGNVQGAVANVSLAPIVTAIDPLFIGTEYKLQRELIPPSVFDSYMVAQSTFYLNGMTVARDLGAWSGIEVNKETVYLREFAFLLPAKTDAVASIKHNRVNLWVSETGVPDVVNTPDGAWEELLMTYGSLPTQEFGRLKNHLEFLDWLETLTDMTVELRLDPNYTPSTSITTGAAAAVDQPFIVVGSGTVKSGYRITIAGKTYSVGLVSGVYAVLDRGLEDAVLNGQTLEVASIIGYGTYQYIPQTDRRLTRWAHDRTDFMRGFILRFARKWV